MARKGMRSYSSAGESEATQPQHSDAQGRPRKHQQQGLLALKAARIRRRRRRLSDCASRLGNCFNKATLNKWVRRGGGSVQGRAGVPREAAEGGVSRGASPCSGVPACRAKRRRWGRAARSKSVQGRAGVKPDGIKPAGDFEGGGEGMFERQSVSQHS